MPCRRFNGIGGTAALKEQQMIDLYPFQKKAGMLTLEAWDSGIMRTLLVMATGTGKTITFADITRTLITSRRARVLILAHRDELIRQAQDKIFRFTGIRSAIEKAEETALGSFFRVTIGSVQTLCGDKRLAQFAQDYYSHIIVDEAHHVLGSSYLKILNHFSGAKLLGVTATPDRGDKRDLGNVFENIAFEYPLMQAIKEGYLCPIKAQTMPLTIDVSNIGIGADGDYDKGQLGTALDPYLPQIAAELWRTCKNRKLLVFLPLRDTARRMAVELARVGFMAYYVGGDDRSQLTEWDTKGAGAACCNAMLLTEGYDNPAIDAVCVLRMTKVRSLLVQMLGRGTRLSPGKEFLFVPDFLWHTDRLDLCRVASLVAPSQEIANLMMEKQDAEAKEEKDPEQGRLFGLTPEEISAAQREIIEQREKAIAKQLEEMRKKKAKLVDPIQFAASIADEDIMDYVPNFAHEAGPATEAQIKALEKSGIFTEEGLCLGKASMILDRLATRRDNGMSSPKQIRCLERYGVKHAGECSFDAAQRAINRLAANAWRKPWDNWTDADGRLV
jgi:superfamily II DNA or RNA helicase